MNKRIWALLLLAYFVVLIIIAPSSLLGVILDSVSNSKLTLANTRGTIWRGSANPILRQRDGGLITLSELHWNIAPLDLLTGKLSIQLNWLNEPQALPMNIVASPAKVELQHVYIPLPAILLDEASDFLKPAALRGQFIVKSDSLIVTKQGVQGTATADWLNASSLLSSISPLGDYHFNFSSTPSLLNITLNTTTGDLLLAGQGSFSVAAGLDFRGTAQAAAGKEEALRELLSHLGPQERPGVNTFTLVPPRVH